MVPNKQHCSGTHTHTPPPPPLPLPHAPRQRIDLLSKTFNSLRRTGGNCINRVMVIRLLMAQLASRTKRTKVIKSDIPVDLVTSKLCTNVRISPKLHGDSYRLRIKPKAQNLSSLLHIVYVSKAKQKPGMGIAQSTSEFGVLLRFRCSDSSYQCDDAPASVIGD